MTCLLVLHLRGPWCLIFDWPGRVAYRHWRFPATGPSDGPVLHLGVWSGRWVCSTFRFLGRY